jgi:hypothetical protein
MGGDRDDHGAPAIMDSSATGPIRCLFRSELIALGTQGQEEFHPHLMGWAIS